MDALSDFVQHGDNNENNNDNENNQNNQNNPTNNENNPINPNNEDNNENNNDNHGTSPAASTSLPSSAGPVSTPAIGQGGAPAPSGPVTNDFDCQWQGCTTGQGVFTDPHQLYRHLTDDHIGRKVNNNLTLTCGWGLCGTVTVKRDHITSHVRVHVPFRPARCSLCGRGFKRVTDLRKHFKTHTPTQQLGPPAGLNAPSTMLPIQGVGSLGGLPAVAPMGYHAGGLQPGPSPYHPHGQASHGLPAASDWGHGYGAADAPSPDARPSLPYGSGYMPSGEDEIPDQETAPSGNRRKRGLDAEEEEEEEEENAWGAWPERPGMAPTPAYDPGVAYPGGDLAPPWGEAPPSEPERPRKRRSRRQSRSAAVGTEVRSLSPAAGPPAGTMPYYGAAPVRSSEAPAETSPGYYYDPWAIPSPYLVTPAYTTAASTAPAYTTAVATAAAAVAAMPEWLRTDAAESGPAVEGTTVPAPFYAPPPATPPPATSPPPTPAPRHSRPRHPAPPRPPTLAPPTTSAPPASSWR